MDTFHALSGLETLLNAKFSNFNIKILFAELSSLVLVCFHVFRAKVIFNLGLNEVVFGLCVTNEVNHEWWGLS